MKASTIVATDKSLYRTIWRWHFYAGIFCIPFVILLALTGAIYLFKPYYENWQENKFHQLSPGENRISANEQIQAALDAGKRFAHEALLIVALSIRARPASSFRSAPSSRLVRSCRKR